MARSQTGAEVKMDPELVLGRRSASWGAARVAAGRAPRARDPARSSEARPIPRDREDRLFQALGRLEQNHRVELAANEAYERWRAPGAGHARPGVEGQQQAVRAAASCREGTINLSDPDSRVMRTQGTPPRQAYNAQTA